MNRTVAMITQWAGRLTVVLALITFIWSVSDIVSDNTNAFGPNTIGPNDYTQALSFSASLAVTGMLAMGIGMMLEKFTND